MEIPVGVAYGSDPRRVMQILKDVARKLGAGGMFIATDTRKPVGSYIEVEFELPDLGVVTIDGRVVYLQDADESRSSGMGIEFEGVVDGLRSQLDRYVRSLSNPGGAR